MFYSEEKEEDGYLACATGAAGADPNQVIVKADLDKDCVLKIMPMMQYREGADAQGAPPIDVLQSQLEGKVIIYGQIIQLMHARTQARIHSLDFRSIYFYILYFVSESGCGRAQLPTPLRFLQP